MKNARESHIDKVCACIDRKSSELYRLRRSLYTYQTIWKRIDLEENEIAKFSFVLFKWSFLWFQYDENCVFSVEVKERKGKRERNAAIFTVPFKFGARYCIVVNIVYLHSSTSSQKRKIAERKKEEQTLSNGRNCLVIKEFKRLQFVFKYIKRWLLFHTSPTGACGRAMFFALMPRTTTTTTTTTNDIEFSCSPLLSSSLLNWFDVGCLCYGCCSIVFTSVFNLPVSQYECKNTVYFLLSLSTSFSHWILLPWRSHIVSMNWTDKLHAQNTEWQFFIASNQPCAV